MTLTDPCGQDGCPGHRNSTFPTCLVEAVFQATHRMIVDTFRGEPTRGVFTIVTFEADATEELGDVEKRAVKIPAMTYVLEVPPKGGSVSLLCYDDAEDARVAMRTLDPEYAAGVPANSYGG